MPIRLKSSSLNRSLLLFSTVAVGLLAGCAQQHDTTGLPVAMAANVPAHSVKWCQDNYLSAAVSHQQRSNNAKYCDPQARQQFLEQNVDAKRVRDK